MAPADAVVVDASVAAKWHLTDEEHAAPALLLLDRFSRGAVELHAPEYIRYEVPSAITAATIGRKPRLTPELAEQAIERFLRLGLTTHDSDQLVREAFLLFRRYGCALYDGLYLALSQRLRLPLVIADRKLYRRVGHLPEVVWIAEYGGELAPSGQGEGT